MSATVAMYIGSVVAVLILLWGAVEVGRRYFGRKKIDASIMNTWVPLNSPIDDASSYTDGDDEQEDALESDIQTRAQQNGHYSESKKTL